MTVDTISAGALEPFMQASATRSLAEWAGELEAAHRIAKALCSTSFVPAAWRGKPDQGAAAILTGAGMGLSPTTSLQIFFEVNGRIGIESDAKVALVRSAGHDIWTEERTADRCTVAGRRKGWPDARVERITITMADAKNAGWTSNATYAKTPADMLYHRTSARVCSAIAPEVLYGIPVVDELEDLPPLSATAHVDRPRPATLAEIVAPAAEPEPVDIGDAPLAMTQPQSRKLFALLRKTGREDRELALDRIGEILGGGRVITSTKELSKAEAIVVIDALEAEERQPAQPERDPWDVAVEAEQPELV